MSGEGFANPVANALNQLVRALLQSDNFVPGVSGWVIRKDGTAEFYSTVIRGSLTVTDPDGSQVHIYDQNPGNGAIIDMSPATVPGHAISTPFEIRHVLNTSNRPMTEIESATLDGVTPGAVMQMYADELGNQSITLQARNVTLDGRLAGAVSGTGFAHFSNMSEIFFGTAELLLDNGGFIAVTLPTPTGQMVHGLGKGIIGVMYYTGGIGVTSGGAGEAALPAWTFSDGPFRFPDGRKFSAEIGGGTFTSTVSPSPAEVSGIRLRSAVNSTTAQVLGSLQVPTPAGGSVQSWSRTIYFKNNSGADIDKTSLGLTVVRAAGAGNASLFGNAAPGPTGPLYCILRDEGFINETGLDNMIVAMT